MIAIIAKIRVKPGQGPAFEKQVLGMTAKVESFEAGNFFYRGFRTDDPNEYIALEAYHDQAAIDAHRASDHVAEAMLTLPDLLDGDLDVEILEQVY